MHAAPALGRWARHLHDIIMIFFFIIIMRALLAIKVQVLQSSLPDLSRHFLARSCLGSFLTLSPREMHNYAGDTREHLVAKVALQPLLLPLFCPF